MVSVPCRRSAGRPERGRWPRIRLGALTTAAAVVVLAGCTENAAPNTDGVDGDPRSLSVNATDTDCGLSATSAPSGKLTFSVTNAGSSVTEFYLLGADGLRIVGEVENIGPGLTRDLVLNAPVGDYLTACKSGLTGDGIRAPFQVTDSGAGLIGRRGE